MPAARRKRAGSPPEANTELARKAQKIPAWGFRQDWLSGFPQRLRQFDTRSVSVRTRRNPVESIFRPRPRSGKTRARTPDLPQRLALLADRLVGRSSGLSTREFVTSRNTAARP